jgi:D-alanyl-D-alanine carboxypeptidase
MVPPRWAAAPRRASDVIAPIVEAHAAIVIDEASGATLFEKNAHQALPPASLTKITTAIIAITRLDLNQWIDVDVDSHKMLGSSIMGLRPGDRFQVRDLLYGLMLPSGNDAALALARAVSGSDAAFVVEMNAFADRLGLRDIHFVNPHGLSDQSQVASAYDLAILSRYGMALPAFARIILHHRRTHGRPQVPQALQLEHLPAQVRRRGWGEDRPHAQRRPDLGRFRHPRWPPFVCRRAQ